MNRRQAKKAFKKKYGVNPGEVMDLIIALNELRSSGQTKNKEIVTEQEESVGDG